MKTLYFQELERLESERSRIWHEIGHAPACPPWAAGQGGECAGEYPKGVRKKSRGFRNTGIDILPSLSLRSPRKR